MKNNNTILALGADIKSRFCLLRTDNLSLSKDFGELDNIENFNKYKLAISKIGVRPTIVAFDMHPGYFSSQLIAAFNAKRNLAVQHHHAHIASVLFANDVRKPVIGIAFDGTGYGSDGNLWGGEFLIVDKAGFRRFAHLKYLSMPGAELAIKQPWRMAFSIIYDCLDNEIFKQDLEFLRLESKDYYKILIKMVKHDINSPLTSSAGRLFDAVSSILGVCHKINFEAEAAIKLEKLAAESKDNHWYEFEIFKGRDCYIISHNRLIKAILKDIEDRVSKEDIAKRFHNSLANLIIKMLDKINKVSNLRDVVLSGGVFQNRLLFDSVREKINESGYNLIYNNDVPVNDLGICLGQIYIALHSK